MIRTAGQCVVGPKGVGVEVMAEGPFEVTVEGLAEVDGVGSAIAAEVEGVVADDVVACYRRSW